MKSAKKLITYCIGTIVIVALVYAVAYSIVSDTPSTNDSDNTIKIGALLCLTGECAEWGENSLQGMQLAVEELNAQGGVLGNTLEIVVRDSGEGVSANKAVTAYRAARSIGIEYFIGPSWTPAGIALHPVIAQDNVIVTSPSLGVAEFNEAADNIFNVWPHDAVATQTLAQLAIDNGWTRTAVFSSKQPWEQLQGEVFAEEFERLGGEITILVEPIETSRDLKTEAAKILETNPDVIMFSNGIQMGTAAKELKNLGYTGHKLAILMDETRVNSAEGGLDNTIYAQYPAAGEVFTTQFTERFGTNPGITTDNAYDAVMLYALAIEQAQTTDVTAVSDVMNSFTHYRGASGEFTFDQLGGIEKEPVFWQVDGTNFVLYQ